MVADDAGEFDGVVGETAGLVAVELAVGESISVVDDEGDKDWETVSCPAGKDVSGRV